jgi:outer membrane protein TolC
MERVVYNWLAVFVLLNVYSFPLFADNEDLTLDKAVSIAIERSPELKQLRSQTRAITQEAVAAGQLDDPKMLLNLSNLPTDTFNFVQEDMTQFQMGVGQSFPKGRSKTIQRFRLSALAKAEAYRFVVKQLEIMKEVREYWLELFYWRQAKSIMEEQRSVFEYLKEITQSMVANGALQEDAIRAILELDKVVNRILLIDQNISTIESELGYWIGFEEAESTLPVTLPKLPDLPELDHLEAALEQHSELFVKQSEICAKMENVRLKQEDYKPGWDAQVLYGVRGGRRSNGNKRSDFISAGVVIDLPIFPKNRQSRRLSSSIDSLHAAKDEKISTLWKLESELKRQWQNWFELGDRVVLYETMLVPRAQDYSKSTLVAYQNAESNFNTVSQAYVMNLELQLESLRVSIEKAKVRVAILYLQGM